MRNEGQDAVRTAGELQSLRSVRVDVALSFVAENQNSKLHSLIICVSIIPL